MARLFLRALGLVLVAYAVLGKGFAYFGLPPMYVGELAMALGLLAVLADARLLRALPSWSDTGWPLVYLLFAWGALRTIPYVTTHGMDALRDGVLWGYALFAVLVFAVITAFPRQLWALVHAYGQFAAAYPGVMLGVLAALLGGLTVPVLAYTEMPLIVVKPGDVGVHLGGVLLFWLVGLRTSRSLLWLSLLLAAFFVISIMGRAAALAFVAAGGTFVLVAREFPRHTRRLLLAAAIVVAVSLSLAPAIEVRPGRWLTPQQFVANLVSTVAPGEGQVDELSGTRAWRLTWWLTIVNYTIRGDRFWLGKGFGVDLAEADGFPSGAGARPNRSPHSAHMDFLARAGVPGLALWLSMLFVWGRAVLRCYSESKRSGRPEWAALFLFLFGYWLSFLVNASFDAFLEGPMGGIWFWSLMGAGLAAVKQYRRTTRSSLAADSKAG